MLRQLTRIARPQTAGLCREETADPVEAAALNGSTPSIFGKRQSIDDVPAEGQSREILGSLQHR